MHNFYLINSKLRKLDDINELEARIRGLEKETKFTNNKLDTALEKLPKDVLTRKDVRSVARDQVFDILNAADEKFMSTKYPQNIKQEINDIR